MKEPALRAPRNRTLALSKQDAERLRRRLLIVDRPVPLSECAGRTILGDSLLVLPLLPKKSVDLLIVDPPYNLTKAFSSSTFKKQPLAAYEEWLHSWLPLAVGLLKSSASVYVCSEWRSSGVIQRALERYFMVQNRITWEREKGRGALRNWKNCSEDIGIEQEEIYCLLAEKRLELAHNEPSIQGYSGGYFWERNSLAFQDTKNTTSSSNATGQSSLFEDHS